MKNQKIRSMKVHEQSGYNYKASICVIMIVSKVYDKAEP